MDHRCLTNGPQYVMLLTAYDVAVCSTGAPQGTVLLPLQFTLYSSVFRFNAGTCHLQKTFSDLSIAGCISEGNEQGVTTAFVDWGKPNNLRINARKTEETINSSIGRNLCLVWWTSKVWTLRQIHIDS